MTIIDTMKAKGYVFRRPEELAILGLADRKGMRALLVEGVPGAGKTYLAETFALANDYPLVAYQFHEWTDSTELFIGINVAEAVAGNAEGVRQDGVLAMAARASAEGPVVLLLDELDKAPERVEYLLLDALQSGRVPVAPGVHLRMSTDNIYIFATSNGTRPMSQALMRRFRRVMVDPLPVSLMDTLVVAETKARIDIVTMIRKLAVSAAEKDTAVATTQEIAGAVTEVMKTATCGEDIVHILSGWLARGQAGRAYTEQQRGQAARLYLMVMSARNGKDN